MPSTTGVIAMTNKGCHSHVLRRRLVTGSDGHVLSAGPHQGAAILPGDIWPCLETCLVFALVRECLASMGSQ